MGEWLPPDVRVWGDPPLVLSTTNMMLEDLSVVSPSVQPMSSAIIWAAIGAGGTAALGAAMVASGCGPPITATTTSTYVGGALSAYVAPTTIARHKRGRKL